MERKNSFRGIQSAISRMNPELLRSVITSATAAKGGPEARSPPGDASFRHATMPLPTLSFASRSGWEGTAPLTIFYNGTVAVFDLPQEKAESILKMAEKGSVGGPVEPSDPTGLGNEDNEADLLAKLNGAELLPIARKRSLERFFAKRKERLTMLQPYKRADCEVSMALVKETGTITAA